MRTSDIHSFWEVWQLRSDSRSSLLTSGPLLSPPATLRSCRFTVALKMPDSSGFSEDSTLSTSQQSADWFHDGFRLMKSNHFQKRPYVLCSATSALDRAQNCEAAG